MSDKAREEDKEKFKNMVLFTEEQKNLDKLESKIATYHINSLDTDVVIIDNTLGYFVYDDILYYYAVINYSKSEMLNILENINN